MMYTILIITVFTFVHLSESTRMQFFKSVTQALVDFNELNPIAPLQLLLEVLLLEYQVCYRMIEITVKKMQTISWSKYLDTILI